MHVPLLNTAIASHHAGDLPQAAQLYRQILHAQPEQPDALHLLGLIAHQQGRVAEAIELIQRAVRRLPDNATLRFNLAASLAAADRTDEAIENYHHATRLKPDLPDAWQNLAGLLAQRGQLDAALECAERRHELLPESDDAKYNLGYLLARLGRYADAIGFLAAAVEIAPSNLRAWNQWALCLCQLQQFDAAINLLSQCAANVPRHVPTWINLGRCLQDAGQHDRAIAAYQSALSIDPACYEALVNLATVHKERFDYTQAMDALETAIRLRPGAAEAHHDLAQVYEELGEFQQALHHFDQALACQPDQPETRLTRALLLIQVGRLSEGWTDYQWRWLSKDSCRLPQLAVPVWDGSRVTGKSLLVFAEQGVGDEIMFASCYRDLLDRGARLTIVCEPRLHSLFARSFDTSTVVAMKQGSEDWSKLLSTHHDFQIPAGSLPLYLRGTLSEFPRHERFLIPDPDRVAHWRSRLAELGAGPKIGISWRAGISSKHRRHRSTDLIDWLPLLQTPGVHFVNLQYGNVVDDLTTVRAHGCELHDWPAIDPLADLDEVAALTSAVDLVISVGNAAVHLAGAIGTPCWALLPKYWGWRWLIDRADTPWYRSVRLIRQQTSGDWPNLFQHVAREIQHYSARDRRQHS